METGELDGMCSTVQSFRNFRPDWIKSGVARVLFTLEREPVPWTGAPTIYEFTKTDEQRQTLEYFSSSIEYGRPMLLPPEVPVERVRMLRRAFEATVNDPQFRERGAKARPRDHAANRRAARSADPRGQGRAARDHRAGHQDDPVAGQLNGDAISHLQPCSSANALSRSRIGTLPAGLSISGSISLAALPASRSSSIALTGPTAEGASDSER